MPPAPGLAGGSSALSSTLSADQRTLDDDDRASAQYLSPAPPLMPTPRKKKAWTLSWAGRRSSSICSLASDTPDGRLSSPPVASGRPCRRSRVEPSRLPRHRRCELGSPPSPATEGTCPSPKTSTGRLLTSPSASRARSSQRRRRASASSAHSSALMGTWCHRRSNPSPVFATMLTSLPARALSSLTSRARCATTRRG
jgi:hypothetical protein